MPCVYLPGPAPAVTVANTTTIATTTAPTTSTASIVNTIPPQRPHHYSTSAVKTAKDPATTSNTHSQPSLRSSSPSQSVPLSTPPVDQPTTNASTITPRQHHLYHHHHHHHQCPHITTLSPPQSVSHIRLSVLPSPSSRLRVHKYISSDYYSSISLSLKNKYFTIKEQLSVNFWPTNFLFIALCLVEVVVS
jgi:hypothetical protein